MKFCPKCSTALEDSANFCATCGTNFAPVTPAADEVNNNAYSAQYAQQIPPQQPMITPIPVADPFDHTDEFDTKDISDNKVIAMLIYLCGFIGIIIALLSQNKSEYVAFHLRQALKFMVCTTLLGLASIVLGITVIVPFACMVAIGVLSVIKIICFIDICNGKAKEPAIIRNLTFLK